ncbi:MAG: hypothetical protein A2X32_09675 [Elusimicrobia bacterium GWC2_64_44]|nr:MAG: hypothetical protein A2X32_09675 [Elusimicrobia bacterium GWC2_64_44]
MKKITFLIIAAALAAPVLAREGAPTAAAVKPEAAVMVPETLAAQGRKNPLPGGGWFTWKFDKKPQLGALFVKVQIFNKDKEKDTSYELTGESGMPSMPYHDTGKVYFKLNKKGDYLLPVDVVMAGEWRLVIRLMKDGKEVTAGKVDYSV